MLFVSPGLAWGLTLSIDDAVSLALDQDAELRRQDLALEAAERSYDLRWGLFLPSLTAQAGANYSRPFFTEDPRPDADPWRRTSSLGLSLQLSPAVAPQIASLQVARRNASIVLDRRALEVAAQVRRRYYGLIQARERHALLAEDVRLSREQEDQTRIRYENGLVSRRVLQQAELAAERARLEYRRGQASSDLELMRFRSLLGLDGDIALTDQLDFPAVSLEFEAVLRRFPADAHDGRMRELALESARLARQQEQLSVYAPAVTFSSSWSASFSDPWSDSLGFGISVALPLDGWVPASTRAQRVDRARLQETQSEITRDDQGRQYVLQLRELVAQVNQTVEETVITELQIEIAEQSLQLAEEGFSRGTVERLELERSRRDLLDARMGLVAARYQYSLALTELSRLVGVFDPRDILSGQE